MRLMSQFGKVCLYGLMRSVEFRGFFSVSMAEVPPTEQAENFSPVHPSFRF